MLKQDKVFYSSLIGILLNTVSFLMREHKEVFLCPYLNPILFDSKHFYSIHYLGSADFYGW